MKLSTTARSSLATTAALLLCGLIPIAAALPQQPPFRTGARTVAVYATVTDKDGRLVPDLGRDAFEIRDNGKPQPITLFASETQPIRVVLMLDRSGSMRGNVRLVEQAAAEFIKGLRPDDTARLGVFADRIDIQPPAFTSDHQELLKFIHSDVPVTGPTPLWNALHQAVAALSGQNGRKVVLVFSDGGNSPENMRGDNHSLADVMAAAQRDDVMVYAIGVQTTVLGNRGGGGIGGMTGRMTSLRPDPGLGTIAEETGGGYFELTRGENLSETFAQVAEELHRQYAIGFEPPLLDDKMHKLDVRVNQRGMKVRARKNYFARRP